MFEEKKKEYQLKNRKLVAATVLSAVALSIGNVSLASADDRKMGKDAFLGNVLNGLVAKGTVTASQVDAIQKALKDSKTSMKSEVKALRTAYVKVLTDTLGISESDLTSRLKAGESLAAIAGSKKDALIAAIVTFQTKNIDDALATGKITSEQAAKLKAKLQERVTKEIERAKGLGMGMRPDFKGGMGHGMGQRP